MRERRRANGSWHGRCLRPARAPWTGWPGRWGLGRRGRGAGRAAAGRRRRRQGRGRGARRGARGAALLAVAACRGLRAHPAAAAAGRCSRTSGLLRAAVGAPPRGWRSRCWASAPCPGRCRCRCCSWPVPAAGVFAACAWGRRPAGAEAAGHRAGVARAAGRAARGAGADPDVPRRPGHGLRHQPGRPPERGRRAVPPARAAPRRSTRRCPVDRMPLVWRSKYPIYYVLAAASSLSGPRADRGVRRGVRRAGRADRRRPSSARPLRAAAPRPGAALLAMGLVGARPPARPPGAAPVPQPALGNARVAADVAVRLALPRAPRTRGRRAARALPAARPAGLPADGGLPGAGPRGSAWCWSSAARGGLPRGPRLPRTARGAAFAAGAVLVAIPPAAGPAARACSRRPTAPPRWSCPGPRPGRLARRPGRLPRAGLVLRRARARRRGPERHGGRRARVARRRWWPCWCIAAALAALRRLPRDVAAGLGAAIVGGSAPGPLLPAAHGRRVLLLQAAGLPGPARRGRRPPCGWPVPGARRAGRWPCSRAVAAVGLGGACRSPACARRCATPGRSSRPDLLALRDAARRLPPGSSIRLDLPPDGTQLWAGYMLAAHPLDAPRRRSWARPIPTCRWAGRRTTSWPARWAPKRRWPDADGPPVYRNATFRIYRMRPGVQGPDTASQTMQEGLGQTPQVGRRASSISVCPGARCGGASPAPSPAARSPAAAPGGMRRHV